MTAPLLPEPRLAAMQPTALQPTEIQLIAKPSIMPESLLPKSLAAKPHNNFDASTNPDETKPSPVLDAGAMPASLHGSPAPQQPAASPPVKIDLKKPRRMFPLPPEDTPPPKGVGTGDTKRR